MTRREFLRDAGLAGASFVGADLLRLLSPGYIVSADVEAAPPSEPLRTFDHSIYPAGDNNFGRIDRGAVIVDPDDFAAYHSLALEQFNQYSAAAYQDYAISMEATPLPTLGDGSPRLPRYQEIYQPDFWLKQGWGLGFDESVQKIHSVDSVLAIGPETLLPASADGIRRGHFILPQERLWHGMVHSLRSIFQIWFGGSIDLTKYGSGTDLDRLNAALQVEFNRSVAAVGYQKAGFGHWPGPVNLASVRFNIVGDGDVCIAKRRETSRRDTQNELFIHAAYREATEKSTPANNETVTLIDPRSHVEFLTLFDPDGYRLEDSYRFIVLSDDSPADPLRPRERHDLADNFVGKVRARRARWVPCGKPAPKPTETPSPTKTPTPTQVQIQEATQAPSGGGGGEEHPSEKTQEVEVQEKSPDPYDTGGSVEDDQANRENKGDASAQVPFTSGSGGQEASDPGEETIVDPAAGEPTYQDEP